MKYKNRLESLKFLEDKVNLEENLDKLNIETIKSKVISLIKNIVLK